MGLKNTDLRRETEDEIIFKKEAKSAIVIQSKDGSQNLARISGYDVHIEFNMASINSIEDARQVASAISEALLETLINQVITDDKQNKQE